MRFVAGLLDGESMSRLCREFGISRKTGYKIWDRYQETEAYALMDRSGKPHRFGNHICGSRWRKACSGRSGRSPARGLERSGRCWCADFLICGRRP